MDFISTITDHYLLEIPASKKFGAFGASVIKGRPLSLKMKEASMYSLGLAITDESHAQEVMSECIENGRIDKKEYIEELVQAGFEKNPTRYIPSLTFTHPVIWPVTLFRDFEHRVADWKLDKLYRVNNNAELADAAGLISDALVFGIVAGLEFTQEATDMLQLWITKSLAPELYGDENFFLVAPDSYDNLKNQSSKLYHLWKAS